MLLYSKGAQVDVIRDNLMYEVGQATTLAVILGKFDNYVMLCLESKQKSCSVVTTLQQLRWLPMQNDIEGYWTHIFLPGHISTLQIISSTTDSQVQVPILDINCDMLVYSFSVKACLTTTTSTLRCRAALYLHHGCSQQWLQICPFKATLCDQQASLRNPPLSLCARTDYYDKTPANALTQHVTSSINDLFTLITQLRKFPIKTIKANRYISVLSGAVR